MKTKTISYQGHILSYAEYGNPDGYPILIQHGMIASIQDQQIFKQLLKPGARLISIARPGYGQSSPYPLKNVAEWAKIVSVLINDLGLSQFDVFGISSGAPYSYAIGYAFPSQARNVFILSGTPALYDEGVLAFWPYPVNRQASIAELQDLAHELFFAPLSKDAVEQDDIQDSMKNHCFGVALDLKIRCLDWGFPLSDVKANVYMRHSRADSSVPLITAEMTAQLLPHCALDIRENDVHFSQEVVDDFIRAVIAEHSGAFK